MNAITLKSISATLLSSTATATLVLNADATAGWKTEAQRLAQGANRRTNFHHSISGGNRPVRRLFSSSKAFAMPLHQARM